MAAGDGGTDNRSFLQRTSILGLKVYGVIGICLGCFLLLALLTAFSYCWIKSRKRAKHSSRVLLPSVSKEIIEIDPLDRSANDDKAVAFADKEGKTACQAKNFEFRSPESIASGGSCSSSSALSSDVSLIGWGRWYTLKELEVATGGFSADNVIGEGGYGIVYRGILSDGSTIAAKNLLNNKGQAEKEFKVEVEAIGKVRHKNLVGLIGYCAEGTQRVLVYEYVDNGNLDQWLHGEMGLSSPLTWDIRIKIAIGTAKGLAYLHEGLDLKVVHRDVKSSNILLDKQWNPKVSDFGLAKLLGSDSSYVTTRVMGTFGYVAPEYASTGMLNEGSDVYSFGVLLMEIISGRSPIDYARPAGEVNLVDWFKGMVGSRRGEEILDPLIEVQPQPRALKRVLLVCLRCIDIDAQKRPKMGQVVHMLEADEFPFRVEHRLRREGKEDANRGGLSSAGTGSPLPRGNVKQASLERSDWR